MPGYNEYEYSKIQCISAEHKVFLTVNLSISLYLNKNFNRELAFYNTFLTTFTLNRLSSICKPKYLTSLTLLIFMFQHLTSKDSTSLRFLFVPKIITQVLPRCNESLLSMSHCFHDSNSFVSSSAICFGSEPEIIIVLSSVYAFYANSHIIDITEKQKWAKYTALGNFTSNRPIF